MNDIISPPHSHYLQHGQWAAVRARHDWAAQSIDLQTPSGEQAVTIYTRKVQPIGTLGYIPYCLPVLSPADAKVNLDRIKETCRDCFAVIIEPQQLKNTVNESELHRLGLKRTWMGGIQNLSTLIVDLTKSEDEIMAAFTKEKRYNVRKAEKRGVVVRELPADEKAFDIIWKFKELTIERSGHYYRPKDFMYDVWSTFASANKARVFVAYQEEKPVSAVLALHDDWQAWSRDSGSLREANSLGAPSYMQWEVMRALKSSGIERYDLCGIRPEDQRDPDNPRYGIFRYKSGFNPDGIEDYCGPYDFVLSSAKYAVWQRAKGLYLRFAARRNYFF